MSLIDTRFQVDESKCVGCGLCQLACPSMLIEMNEYKKPSLKPVKSMDWYGCWGCQHCLTVCPNGAISVLGKKPENSLPLPSDAISTDLERLVCSRRSCRHYKDENVDPELLNELLAALEATPTGGNKQKMEFTVIDDRAGILRNYGSPRSAGHERRHLFLLCTAYYYSAYAEKIWLGSSRSGNYSGLL